MAKKTAKSSASSPVRATRRRPKREVARTVAEAAPVSADGTAPVQKIEPKQSDPEQRASLAVLVYLCGDNHVEAATKDYLDKLLKSAPCSDIHLVIQYDTPLCAKRYVIRAGETDPSANEQSSEEEVRRDVNTGDPKALEEFLKWGLTAVVAEHHVLIFSGLGINPRYVRQSLPLDALPEPLRKARGGKPGDPDDEATRKAFIEQFESLNDQQRAYYRDAIHQRTFSICHDFSNSGSLELSDLRAVLIKSTRYFDEVKRDDRFEAILFHVGAAGFIEVLFELEGLARVFIGSAERLPDSGLPYTEILQSWNKLLHKKQAIGTKSPVGPLSHLLAKDFLTTVSRFNDDKEYGKAAFESIVAANLDTLDEVARVLDALTVALLHSLGDWHVLDAVCLAIDSFTSSCVSANEVDDKNKPIPHKALDDIESVPAVDLFHFLGAIEKSFADKLKDSTVPVEFGQRERIQKLYKLIRKTVAHLQSSRLLPDDSSDGSLLIADDGNENGLSILLPLLRSAKEIQEESGKIYSLATQSYSRLNFSQRVHWSALIGAIQMIREKPHAIWRVISSMLADGSSPARDAVLSRLISSQSVVSQMRGQFRSLGDSESLTMSFDSLEVDVGIAKDLSHFQVRLESSLGGGVVYQHDSRVYRSSLESIWRNLHELLRDSEPIDALVARLQSLGASLGEDVIQDLIGPLEQESNGIISRGEIPHLTLQMPREFMRYPWELMNDGNGMLCERYALGRQVYMESSPMRPSARRNSDLIRVLVIGDPVYTPEFIQAMSLKGLRLSRLPSARAEAYTVARSFEYLSDEMAGVVECQVTKLINQNISMDTVRFHLREGRFDLIHYAGHAFFDAQDGDGSAWVLSDGLLHAREIRNTLARSKQPPWLIFANACEAGMDQLKQGSPNVDVTGLATACINFGVAAYIAPLWPVDDEIAKWLAVRFYRELVHDRYSVGEALRRARCAIWERLKESGLAQTMPARTALTWSSFVLYGDPTSRLLQTLWSPSSGTAKRKKSGAQSNGISRTQPVQSSRFRSALAGQLSATIDFPRELVLASDADHELSRSFSTPATSAFDGNAGIKVELVERCGLHFWRVIEGNSNHSTRTLSPLGRLLDDRNNSERASRKRQIINARAGRERGVLDGVKVIKSWVLPRLDRGSGKLLVSDLVERFDRLQVSEQQLYRYHGANERRRVVLPTDARRQSSLGDDPCDWIKLDTAHGQMNRAVLLLHGTCSSSSSIVNSFANLSPSDRFHDENETESLLSFLLRRYRAVLGFDYWSLSKSPEQNAKLLLAQLPKTWRSGKSRNADFELDIVCHGQGGLIARELMRLSDLKIRVNRVVMVGVPNGGSRLSEPDNWGTMADLLINQVGVDSTGLLGRLSSLLCYLTALGVEDPIPGWKAERPSDSAVQEQQLGTQTYIVASNYVPERSMLSLQSIVNEIGDASLDKFFALPNDIIVETASMWAIDRNVDWGRDVDVVDKENILLFNTLGNSPTNLKPRLQSGVHHFNYFCNRSVREFIRKNLDDRSD